MFGLETIIAMNSEHATNARIRQNKAKSKKITKETSRKELQQYVGDYLLEQINRGNHDKT